MLYRNAVCNLPGLTWGLTNERREESMKGRKEGQRKNKEKNERRKRKKKE